MDGPMHEKKKHTFERHFLLGKLSRDEIDTLLHYARLERYPAGYEIYAKGSPEQSMMAVSISAISPNASPGPIRPGRQWRSTCRWNGR